MPIRSLIVSQYTWVYLPRGIQWGIQFRGGTVANLTSTILERKTISGLTWVADDGCSGLRARISSSRGRRKIAFYYRYRDRASHKQRIVKVGDYPAISIGEARMKVDNELRPIADDGIDVRRESKRRARKSSQETTETIGQLIQEYIEFCELAGISRGSIANYQRYLLPLKFWWGDRHPSELTRADAQAIFYKVQNKGAVTKDGESTGRGGDRAAGLVHSSSRAFYTWLVDKELVDANPWKGQKRMRVGKSGISDKVLSEKDITSAFTLDGRNGTVLRLLLSTGLRPSNVCGGRWSDIKKNKWTIPADRMKWKDGPDHVIFLSDYTQSVLRSWRLTQRGRPRYIFPTEGVVQEHLRVDMLRWDGFSSKACRATVRTLLQSLGCPVEVRSRISHHSSQTQIEKVYDKHNYDAEAQQWWQALGEHLTQLEPDATAGRCGSKKKS
ncbi:MAG: integrase arm-type DNA-binding domain-containing protein [Halioglobus sp.]|nr:integrase arm-type DNA-binding domain-containing protein [Halioglobus sp.]